jgi:hypothetical protein
MTTLVSDGDQLYELLTGLGQTPDEVAESLRAAGVTGKREDAECCPVAIWLKRATGADPYVDCEAASVRYVPDAPEVETSSPMAVRGFVVRFDHHQYPDLERIEDSNP